MLSVFEPTLTLFYNEKQASDGDIEIGNAKALKIYSRIISFKLYKRKKKVEDNGRTFAKEREKKMAETSTKNKENINKFNFNNNYIQTKTIAFSKRMKRGNEKE